jgi:hypothetical protein
MSVDQVARQYASATWGPDAGVLASLSESFDPRQQNCIRHGVDI